MSKLTKDEKIFLKFRNEFPFIFNDKIFNKKLDEHFDKDGVLACYCLALICNKFSKTRLIKLIKNNPEPWLTLFTNLYIDKDIIQTYDQLELNPCIEFNKVISSFKCFDRFIRLFINFIKNQNIEIGFEFDVVEELLKKGVSFLLYNMIDCQIPYDLQNIIRDEKYESKVQMVIYNTRLFSALKQLIVTNCENNINDLIVLVLGMSKNIGEEK